MSMVSSKRPFLITPNDTTDLAYTTRAISFATAGTLTVSDEDGNVVTIPSGSLAPGLMHAINTNRVYDTDTTVTGITGYA